MAGPRDLRFFLWPRRQSESAPESSEEVLEDDEVSSDDVSNPDSGLEEEVDNESDELGSSCGLLFSLAGSFLPERLGRSSSEDSSLSLEPLGSDEPFQGPLLSLWPRALPSTANFIPWGMLFPFPNLTAVSAFAQSGHAYRRHNVPEPGRSDRSFTPALLMFP